MPYTGVTVVDYRSIASTGKKLFSICCFSFQQRATIMKWTIPRCLFSCSSSDSSYSIALQVGNPITDDYHDNKGLLEYAWSHAVISDQTYDKAKSVCDFKLENWSQQCNEAMSTVFQAYNEIDIYNIYAPSCLINGSATSFSLAAVDSATSGKVTNQ